MELSYPFTKPKEEILADALRNNAGTASWKRWKAHSAQDIVALANEAPRMTLLDLSIAGDFKLAYHIHMPVPVRNGDSELRVVDGAVFCMRYLDEWRTEPPPPYAILGALHPHGLFHPNVRRGPISTICVGDVPAGVMPREIVLLGYYALSNQQLTIDETDPQGVLMFEACDFYRNHPEYVPLTRAGLTEPWERWKGPIGA